MKISGVIVRLALGSVFCFSLLTVGGCTKYASPDDLKTLNAAGAAATSAENELAKTKLERQNLEKQLTAKQAELDAAKAEYDRVKAQ